jgi:hypothetical protein
MIDAALLRRERSRRDPRNESGRVCLQSYRVLAVKALCCSLGERQVIGWSLPSLCYSPSRAGGRRQPKTVALRREDQAPRAISPVQDSRARS